MKSHLIRLLSWIFADAEVRCRTSTSSDLKKVRARVEHEGLSFLTITLPAFGKDFERGLELKQVDSTLFVGYARSGCLPRFLSGFTSQVFDPASGTLLEDPSIDAIHSVRQICNLFGKMNLPCAEHRREAAIDKFLECEQQVKEHDAARTDDQLHQFKLASWAIWDGVLRHMDKSIEQGTIIPKHGPGATADRLKGNRKYDQTQWTSRLEEVFPHGEYLFTSWSHFLSEPEVDLLEPGEELPVKVTLVPKTLKTPRIIAIEPTCMQFMQQGLMECCVDRIERDDILSHLVGFSSQEESHALAERGSLDGSLATLDLSEASDRVSNQLVRAMSSKDPWLAMGLDATRSRKADVPGRGVIRLAKYASMGSALCFPIEAMVFFTLVMMGIADELNVPVSLSLCKRMIGKVRIYGDDIIVPVEFVPSVIRTLTAFGLKVNSDKSFWSGSFRETCGKDYYAGVDVSIVKVRRSFPTARRHVQEIISIVSLRNQLLKAGYWTAVRGLDDYIERLIPFPVVSESSPCLGRHTFLGVYDSEKECPHLQRPLVKGFRQVSVIPKSNLGGHSALLKYFLKRGDEPFFDAKHLERAGRPVAVDIKLGWVPSI